MKIVLCLLVSAVIGMGVAVVDLGHRVKAIEERPVPLPCRTWQSLYENRRISAIHSYAKDVRICEVQP